MESLKGDIYKIRYTSKLADIGIKKNRTGLKKWISNNKILFFTYIIFITTVIFDCVLIYNFFQIIEKIR